MNLIFEFRAELRDFLLAWCETVDPILLISGNYWMLTTLKGFVCL